MHDRECSANARPRTRITPAFAPPKYAHASNLTSHAPHRTAPRPCADDYRLSCQSPVRPVYFSVIPSPPACTASCNALARIFKAGGILISAYRAMRLLRLERGGRRAVAARYVAFGACDNALAFRCTQRGARTPQLQPLPDTHPRAKSSLATIHTPPP
ncbi:hypothetical protein HYPSUDRAFT_42126 [Hypholoma sublateritium FD-334 SS-4]|uniref:Uncharacterized protein n=1 Tax=Hypholoma sublateritium (strain FD-334 SS-4) TaxID=945553 RepID=A0A0D2L3D8_HYPSF|nr:hypothetical protein HYPSUDRAFT_42126 [Hypholoma sublateritium FD-334 SS-4]